MKFVFSFLFLLLAPVANAAMPLPQLQSSLENADAEDSTVLSAEEISAYEAEIERLAANGESDAAEEMRWSMIELVNGGRDRGHGHHRGHHDRGHRGHGRGGVIIVPIPIPIPGWGHQPHHRPHRPHVQYGSRCWNGRHAWHLGYQDRVGSPCGRYGHVIR